MPPPTPDDRERRPDSGDVAPLLGRPSPSHLVIGEIVAPRGVRGEVRVRIITDTPDRFLALESVLLGPEHKRYQVRRARLHQKWALLEFVGIDDRDAAEALRGQLLWVPRDQAIALGENEFFLCDIIGLQVIDDDGNELGQIIEIIATGANDVYVVRTVEGDLLLPAIRDIVLTVDISAGLMRVRVPDGLR